MTGNYQNNSPINSNFNNMDLSNCNHLNNLYRSNYSVKKEQKKLNFKSMKNNTISSLNDVEHFLNKLQHTIRYIKLYKLLK